MKSYCFFSAQYLPHLGGVEKYTYNVAKELIKHGNKVTVVTSNISNLKSTETIEGIDIVRLPCINLMKNGRFPIPLYNSLYHKLIKELSAEYFDLVVVNVRFYFHSLCGQKFAYKNAIKCITIDHGTNHMTMDNKILDFIGEVYEHLITYQGKRYCNMYFGVSKAASAWLKHFKIISCGELYNAVDLYDIETRLKKTTVDYKDKYKVPENAIILSFTGRLIKEKGIEKLITSVEQLNNSYDNIYLFIAGDGLLMDYVNDHKSRNIIPLGKIGTQEIVDLLKITDVFCFPTDFPEGFSTSLLEAAACHCYIITTIRGSSNELILNENYGNILVENTAEQIKEGIVWYMGHKSEAISATERTYQNLINNYTWEKTAAKLQKLTE